MNFIEPFFSIPKYQGFSEHYYVCEIYQKYRVFHALLVGKQLEELECGELLKVTLNDGHDIGRFRRIIKYKSNDIYSPLKINNNNLFLCSPLSEIDKKEIDFKITKNNELSKIIYEFVILNDIPSNVTIVGIYIQYDLTKVYIYYSFKNDSKGNYWDFKKFVKKIYQFVKSLEIFSKLRISVVNLN